MNLSNLAGLLAARGEVLEAEQLYIRGLRIRERILGDGQPEVALMLNNLAMLYESCGRREEAKRSVERALFILEGAVGPTAQDTDLPKKLRQAPEEAPAIRAADTAAHARRRMRKSR